MFLGTTPPLSYNWGHKKINIRLGSTFTPADEEGPPAASVSRGYFQASPDCVCACSCSPVSAVFLLKESALFSSLFSMTPTASEEVWGLLCPCCLVPTVGQCHMGPAISTKCPNSHGIPIGFLPERQNQQERCVKKSTARNQLSSAKEQELLLQNPQTSFCPQRPCN